MKFEKVGFNLLFFLVVYWVFAIFVIILLVSLGTAFIFCLKGDNAFYFDWFKESTYAINKAVPSGVALGIGIWIKARLQERQEKKKSTKPDEQ